MDSVPHVLILNVLDLTRTSRPRERIHEAPLGFLNAIEREEAVLLVADHGMVNDRLINVQLAG